MERLDALTIVNRIECAWPNERWHQPRIDLWIDTLLELDAGAAGTALARLTRTASKCPSIADFRTTTLNLHTHDHSRPVDRCRDCDGTGWVDDLLDTRHRTGCPNPTTCTCHAVRPCHTCHPPERL